MIFEDRFIPYDYKLVNKLNSLRINPFNLEKREYGISIKYFNGDELLPNKQINYGISTDLEIKEGHGYLTVDKKATYFNHREPDLFNEKIGEMICKSLYPISVKINEVGITSYTIQNLNEIIERWEQNKNELVTKYQSPTLDDFLEVMDTKWKDREAIEKSISNDWFWSLFFHHKFIDYGRNLSTDNMLSLSLVPYQCPYLFKGNQRIKTKLTNYHSFIIEFQSEEVQALDYFIENPVNREQFKMSLHVIFDIDIYHCFPMHIRCFFKVYKKDKWGKEKIIKRIEYVQYQQNIDIYKSKRLNEESPFYISDSLTEEEKQKARNLFLGFLED